MTAVEKISRDRTAMTPDNFIEETAEAAYLVPPSEEEEANDNFPAHEILQGCIWRDTESAQQRLDLTEAAGISDRAEDATGWQELDFSEDRRRARGFLDEETGPDMDFQEF
ncbi:hypothetical protein [Sneathiella sp.]|uniref:hypothetical protein n=1 Tax=Sneathiella sp. TaxID=1964365 RepID=UPI00262D94C7|nr:hypothetical protein [Sneathiella sp.]MDF2368933.1 hypothetical protein [Sneathiella sp.]